MGGHNMPKFWSLVARRGAFSTKPGKLFGPHLCGRKENRYWHAIAVIGMIIRKRFTAL